MVEESIINISPDDMPRRWYNLPADLPWPVPEPRDHPEAKVKLKDMPKLMLKHVMEHEETMRRWVRIPDEVLDLYLLVGRPRPLHRAYRLEEELKTPARIYLKREDQAPTGSHKMNHSLPQTYWMMEEGVPRLTTETGAGQWGTAIALSARLCGVKATIYFVRSAYKLKPDRYSFMKMLGADVVPSPSSRTETGKKFLEEDPEHPGSLGIAVGEAAEDALTDDDTKFTVGSLTRAVLLYASINGLETQKQFALADDEPDVMIGCFGGGSNFGGFVYPFVGEVMKKRRECEFITVQCEPDRLGKGEYRYAWMDEGRVMPQEMCYTMGIDYPIPMKMAEGLRYQASSPTISVLVNKGIVKPICYYDEKPIFEAAKLVLQTEGFLPAPESSYAIKAGVDLALECKKTGEEKVIAINISGHGYLDFPGYRNVLEEIILP